jgi:hypothetical protein
MEAMDAGHITAAQWSQRAVASCLGRCCPGKENQTYQFTFQKAIVVFRLCCGGSFSRSTPTVAGTATEWR